jgi:toxin-antitoxin system PIN domain toxin
VKLVDANVLIYAVNESDSRHEQAHGWLDPALVGSEPIGFSWIVLLAFLRLTTRIGLFPRALTVAEANERVRAWLAQPAAVIAEPTARHLEVLAGLLAETGTGGNLVSDAHLAAIAVEHGAEIVTFDADFVRFRGVRTVTPMTDDPAS